MIHTVDGGRPYTIHICAVVLQSWSSKGRVCDAFGVQTESWFLWVVLSDWKSAWNQLGLMTVAPSMHILVWVTLAGGSLSLEVSVMEDFVDVCLRLALLDRKVTQLFV